MTAAPVTGAAPRPVPVPARSPAAEARLRLVPAARPARAPFVLLVLAVLVVGLLVLLLLNTVLAQDAFRVHDLERRGALLSDRQQQLDQALTIARSPALLARRAAALGMVPGRDTKFVRLADGRVVALTTAAPAPSRLPGTPAATPASPAKPGAARPGRPGTAPSGTPGTPPNRARPTPTPTASPR